MMLRKNRRKLDVLGPAPSGFCCSLCGQTGDDMVQIAMPHSRVGLFHRDCAQEFFRVEPTKPKVAAAVLDRKHE